jgi:hypothetical protein
MMGLRIVITCCVLFSVCSTARADHLRVYILTGQSNSLGTTELEGDEFGAGTHPADAKTRFFWSNPKSTGSADPNTIVLHGDSSGEIRTLQMQQGNGVNPTFWGPEIGMARTLFDTGHSNVMVIKVSRGGGGNGFWRPTTGHMANHLMQQIDVALSAAKDAGHTFVVKGFLYLQGESNSEAEAADADERFQSLIDVLRTHINSEYPRAADDMYSVIAEIAASTTNASRIQTTDLQRALAAKSPRIGFIPTRDLALKSDNLHFGRDSKLEIGRRYADAFMRQE